MVAVRDVAEFHGDPKEIAKMRRKVRSPKKLPTQSHSELVYPPVLAKVKELLDSQRRMVVESYTSVLIVNEVNYNGQT